MVLREHDEVRVPQLQKCESEESCVALWLERERHRLAYPRLGGGSRIRLTTEIDRLQHGLDVRQNCLSSLAFPHIETDAKRARASHHPSDRGSERRHVDRSSDFQSVTEVVPGVLPG